MTRVIGAADEFWRLRMTRVDTTDDFDFEWHDDILYRQPNVRQAHELELWTIEAVELADFETIIRVASFTEREDAESYFQRAKDDLAELTKSQFEDAYLSVSGDHTDSSDDDASHDDVEPEDVSGIW